MNIVVGLGNPGEKYQHTRHNVGWAFLDFLAQKLAMPAFSHQKKVFSEVSRQGDFLLVKPQTFMNDSGRAVQAVLNWFAKDAEQDKVFVVYDDLDIELGKFKIQYGSGPKVHNGVNSVREHLSGKEFWNVRIGVDSRQGDRTMSGSDYVLQNFSPDQRAVLLNVFAEVEQELKQRY
jgi:PTH1 family peptidyl-tRNA hydrolase